MKGFHGFFIAFMISDNTILFYCEHQPLPFFNGLVNFRCRYTAILILERSLLIKKIEYHEDHEEIILLRVLRGE